MPVSKAQQKATNKYIAKAYDRINLTVPKGKKDTLQNHAQAMGESVNGFINRAIDHEMARDRTSGLSEGPLGASEGSQGASEAEGMSVYQEAERAQETALNGPTAKEA